MLAQREVAAGFVGVDLDRGLRETRHCDKSNEAASSRAERDLHSPQRCERLKIDKMSQFWNLQLN